MDGGGGRTHERPDSDPGKREASTGPKLGREGMRLENSGEKFQESQSWSQREAESLQKSDAPQRTRKLRVDGGLVESLHEGGDRLRGKVLIRTERLGQLDKAGGSPVERTAFMQEVARPEDSSAPGQVRKCEAHSTQGKAEDYKATGSKSPAGDGASSLGKEKSDLRELVAIGNGKDRRERSWRRKDRRRRHGDSQHRRSWHGRRRKHRVGSKKNLHLALLRRRLLRLNDGNCTLGFSFNIGVCRRECADDGLRDLGKDERARNDLDVGVAMIAGKLWLVRPGQECWAQRRCNSNCGSCARRSTSKGAQWTARGSVGASEIGSLARRRPAGESRGKGGNSSSSDSGVGDLGRGDTGVVVGFLAVATMEAPAATSTRVGKNREEMVESLSTAKTRDGGHTVQSTKCGGGGREEKEVGAKTPTQFDGSRRLYYVGTYRFNGLCKESRRPEGSSVVQATYSSIRLGLSKEMLGLCKRTERRSATRMYTPVLIKVRQKVSIT
ncbi:hypothetical protein R3P38DRAFT_2801321 [Favolaschia claudopus]|uniref:Uncharacterized protein n=1 Tax=Favolaschia claudopus TaxID=2862362 RepID=A0AAV9ZVH5_9AGAR